MRQTLKWVGVAVILVALGSRDAGAAGEPAAGTPASEMLRNAYLAVVDGELARAGQLYADAVTAYRHALGLYGRLQAEYPGWQSALVNYRVAECQNALASLEAALAGKEVPSPLFPAANGTNTVIRLESLLVELRDAREAMAVPAGPAVAAPDSALVKERDQLREQLGQAAKANQNLIRKVSRLEARLNRAGLGGATNVSVSAVAAAVRAEARRNLDANVPEAAIGLLHEAVELMPADTDLPVQLALAQCRAGKFAEAVQTLQAFDTRRPVNADAMLCLGAAYMGLGEAGLARVATEKALALKPESGEANYNMAQILISITPPDLEAVERYYRRALQLGVPADVEFENSLRTALVLSKLKKRSASRPSSFTENLKKVLPIPAQ